MNQTFFRTLILVTLMSVMSWAQGSEDEVSYAKQEAQWIAGWGPEEVDILVAKNLTMIRCTDCGYAIYTDPAARKTILEAALKGHQHRTIFVNNYYPYLEANKLPNLTPKYERNYALIDLTNQMTSDLNGGLEKRHLTPAWMSSGDGPNPPSFGTGSNDSSEPQCKGKKIPILVQSFHAKKGGNGKGITFAIFNVIGQVQGQQPNTWSKTKSLGEPETVFGEDLSGPNFYLLMSNDGIYARVLGVRRIKPYMLVGKRGFIPHEDGYKVTFDPRFSVTAWQIQYENGCSKPELVLSIKGLNAEQRRIEDSFKAR